MADPASGKSHVTAVVVAHNGASWIPHLLASLASASRPPDQLVAVDTGSTDESVDLLRAGIGEVAVLSVDQATGFGAAVAAGLTELEEPTDPANSWVWLLHDDCAPMADTLARLLDVATREPDVAVVGCRVRAWPRGRRLLEVGVSITGTGRRRTGLEPGEYDQGQYDTVRDVLAVSSAGMLVRRDVWASLRGFDPNLPLFRDDVDFGWRASRAGHRVVVAPEALLFHAEAASRGARAIANTARHPQQADRQAALFTVLANCSLLALPFQAVRLFLGSLLRSLGYLVGKLPAAALDELRALGHVSVRPGRLVSARQARRRTAKTAGRSVRPLLPPWWAPYADATESVMDAVAARLRARAGGDESTGSGRRGGGQPLLVLTILLAVSALLAGRELWGVGLLQGGALLPAPPAAADWWHLYGESWHQVQLGSSEWTAPYVAVLGAVGTILVGKSWLVVDLVMLGAVPLAGLGAYVVARRLVVGLPARLWIALTYGLLPVVSGAVSSGHLGTVMALILLPWLVRSVLAMWTGRSWSSVFGVAILLSLMVAFAPVAWCVAGVLALVAAVTCLLADRASMLGRLIVAVSAPLLLLLPWSLRLVTHPRLLLTEAGIVRPVQESADNLGWQALLGRVGAAGDAPAWLTVGVLLAALTALLRSDRRRAVALAWFVVAVSMLVAAVLAQLTVAVPVSGGRAPVWLGVPVTFAQAAVVCAVGLGADRLSHVIRAGTFGWRQPVAAIAAAAAVVATAGAWAWWVVGGTSGDLERAPAEELPAYMLDATSGELQQRVLVVTGDQAQAQYRLSVNDGLRLGEDSVLPVDPPRVLGVTVRQLLSQGSAEDAARLADMGIKYVVLLQPADPRLVASLDGTTGLSRASTTEAELLGWQVVAPVGLFRLIDGADPAPRGSANVLGSAHGAATAEVPAGGDRRVVAIATDEGGFVVSLGGAKQGESTTVAGASGPGSRGSSEVAWGQTAPLDDAAGELHVEHQSTRSRWLLVQALLVAGCLVLAVPGRSRSAGISEPGA